MHCTARRIVVIVNRRRQCVELFSIADIAQVKIQILRPIHVLGADNVIVGVYDVGTVELIPHNTVVKAGRFLHQAGGKLLFRHGTLQQKAEGLHFGRALGAGAGLAARARRRDAVVVGDHQVCPALLGTSHQHFGGVGLDGIVRIHKLQILALSLAQPQVAGGRHAAVGLIDQHNAVVHPGVHLAHLQANVLAAVIQQQNLNVFVSLAADTLYAAGNVILCIVYGDNNTDKRLFRHGGGPPTLYNIPTIP